jgi:hypothetical protein
VDVSKLSYSYTHEVDQLSRAAAAAAAAKAFTVDGEDPAFTVTIYDAGNQIDHLGPFMTEDDAFAAGQAAITPAPFVVDEINGNYRVTVWQQVELDHLGPFNTSAEAEAAVAAKYPGIS